MSFWLDNFSLSLLILAALIAILEIIWKKGKKKDCDWAEIFLKNILFFAVGLGSLWAFMGHAFEPDKVSAFIGWAPSPYEFEVAVANLGIGVLGVASYWAGRGFRLATILMVTCFLGGAAVGHVRQMLQTGDFAAGNAGVIFYTDIAIPLVLWIFYLVARKTK